VRDGECTENTGALCVHPARRNDLTVKVSKLLKKPNVFKQRWAACSGGLDILVVHDGSTEGGCEFGHINQLLCQNLKLGDNRMHNSDR
jgi:hypothetical protein